MKQQPKKKTAQEEKEVRIFLRESWLKNGSRLLILGCSVDLCVSGKSVRFSAIYESGLLFSSQSPTCDTEQACVLATNIPVVPLSPW